MQWLLPWIVIDDEREQHALQQELRRECSPEHILHGLNAQIVARRQDRDDYLVMLEDRRVAVVHLTWQVEHDPHWPIAAIYPNMSDWANVVMVPDNADWDD